MLDSGKMGNQMEWENCSSTMAHIIMALSARDSCTGREDTFLLEGGTTKGRSDIMWPKAKEYWSMMQKAILTMVSGPMTCLMELV